MNSLKHSVDKQIALSEERLRELQKKLDAAPEDHDAVRKIFTGLIESEKKLQRNLREQIASHSKTLSLTTKRSRYFSISILVIGLIVAALKFL